MTKVKEHYYPELAFTRLLARDSAGLYVDLYVGERGLQAVYMVDGQTVSDEELYRISCKYGREIRAARLARTEGLQHEIRIGEDFFNNFPVPDEER